MAIRGELDLASGERLKREAQAALDCGWDISLDLAEVSFLDCGGLHALQDVCTGATHRGLHAVVRSPSPPVRRLVELVREAGSGGAASPRTGRPPLVRT